ncbi:MAG: TPM domain-containing protein [Bacilli bacterium]|nr:TPM domain-containing protein [Bacilli bacterium]
MYKFIKKYILILVFILLLCPFNINALVTQSSDIYVTDNANVLKDETKDYIVTYSDFLKDKEKIDYYVVTLKSLEGINLKEYTDYIYDSFNMNEKGLLIVFSKSDRQLRIKTGIKLSKIIPDDVIEEYINSYFMPYLKDEDWNSGIKNGYSSFYKLLCNYYEIDSSPMTVYNGLSFIKKYKYSIFMIILFICSFISNKLGTYHFNIKKGKITQTFKTDFISILGILLNLYLLLIIYYLLPLGVIVVIGFEVINIIGLKENFQEEKILKRKDNKKLRRKIRKKAK